MASFFFLVLYLSFSSFVSFILARVSCGYAPPLSLMGDPPMVAAAKFAVAEHNKQAKTSSLEFVRVDEGGSQLVAGKDFKLVIVAKDGGSIDNSYYEALVSDGFCSKFRRLRSFKKLISYYNVDSRNYEEDMKEFEQWMKKFARVYNSEAEKAKRFEIFRKTLMFIESFNSVKNRTSSVGLNQFADFTGEEMSMLMGGRVPEELNYK